ncbi:cation:proton antiporter [Swaminathania salitolerans]|uniref:Sodium:proton antiporter n=1 Tax=Swaminathania salitolerans TaxID=182838 RepID=A0A511BM15_9PROT|nr:sodium:proton antiporter [Swaminathania salitolerans]GBQ09560.1 Na+/H+ antiporter [Swaminathania salitolerans LMG 21291]GEL00923.1 sodium:proton antiporter [Swaminathania salitolerans]
MSSLSLFATLLTLCTVCGILNYKILKLPMTIGILLIAMVISLILKGLDVALPGVDLHTLPMSLLASADLPGNLLDGALSFLLFAGALQVDTRYLVERKFSIFFLAIVGTLLAVFLLGGAMYWVMQIVGLPVPFLWCVVLGSILAPTDPVSVVGMLRRLGLPGPIQAIFAGESLFNDGISIVLFGLAITMVTGEAQNVTLLDALQAFGMEAIGGALVGLAAGVIGLLCFRTARDSHLQLLVSLSLATGTFSLAHALEMSGPIAVVVAGLCLGSERAKSTMDDHAREELNSFWTLIDEILNALLFLLIGFEILAAIPGTRALWALLLGIPLSILARALSVFLAILPIHLYGEDRGRMLAVLTWGGLRGGISLSLALTLPAGPMKDILAPICYGIVVFTILVQGLSMERVALRFYPRSK